MRADIHFLKELQEELKNQEHDGNASPRFWVIQDVKIEPAHPDYNMEKTIYIFNDGEHTEFTEVIKLKEFLTEYYLEEDTDTDNEDAIEELSELVENPDTSFEDLWEHVRENLNEDGYFREVPVREYYYTVSDTLFITKKDAVKHLQLNGHHYSRKARVYAMTAWRSPSVGRLWKVLEDFDWDALECKE